MVNYEKKYLKYKTKYLKQKQQEHNSQKGGSSTYEWFKYKTYDFLGIASNVTSIRTEALELFETQLEATKKKISETTKEIEYKEESLKYNRALRENLLNDSPESFKIKNDELEVLEDKYKKDLANTVNTENIERIKKEYDKNKNELTEKLEKELKIREQTYESNLQYSKNMIQHLEQEIELNQKHLKDFKNSVIRFENYIQQTIEHIEGPTNDSEELIEKLTERLEKIKNEESMEVVPLDCNNAINATDLNTTDIPEEDIKLN